MAHRQARQGADSPQNGYSAIFMPAKTRLPLHKATPQALLPSSKVTSVTPSAQSSTARLLRLKAGITTMDNPPNSSNLLLLIPSATYDPPPRATPAPTSGLRLTTTNKTLDLNFGAIPEYSPSSPSKPTTVDGAGANGTPTLTNLFPS